MKDVNAISFTEKLNDLEIKTGDGLLVHSAIQYLGKPAGGPEMYLDVLLEIIGSKGTLSAPAFNFAFARGVPYDPQSSPSEGMGVFSELVRQHPAAKRTMHPLQSVVLIGNEAEQLAGRDTPSAFEHNSVFERMLEQDFKVLLLGADIDAVSFLHYSEQRLSVPYRYWKDFSGRVKRNGDWEIATYRMFVRDLEIDPWLSLDKVKQLLMKENKWKSAKINYGEISTFRAVDFVAAVDHFLQKDPWSLVTNKPENADIID
jgi:aminoglycoside 3-N-acetyltransferase